MKSFTTLGIFRPAFALLAPKKFPLFFWISSIALLDMAAPAICQTPQILTNPGTQTVPVPPDAVGARVVVRGGGGGVQGDQSGNGAGGGGYARAYIGIVPGTPNTTVHVGAGGYGGNGETSWFGNSTLLYANGGKSNLNGGTGSSGGGSSAALGLETFTGGNGTQGTIGFFPGDLSIGGFGGNGAGPDGGIGGIGESSLGLYSEGQAPGGGSGGRFSGTGAGGAGRVEITWLNSEQWEQEAPSLCTNSAVVGTTFVSPSCVSGPTLVTVSSSSHDGDSNAYLYEWQQSSTPDFSANVSPVPNATPAGFTLQVNTTTYFRRKVTFLGFGTVCYTNHVRTLIYAGPVHVNVQAPTDGDGTSWATARNDLQKAIYEKCPHQNEIWVAGGVYRPTIPPTNITDPADNAFFVNINVTLYGGFAGTETSLSQRVLGAHPTILTGDLGNGDTTYHVLLLQNNPILDGFTIRNGRAKGAGNLYVASKELARNRGGGIYLVEGAPLLRNCLLTNNRATNGGGGAYSESLGSYNFQHCTISNNQAGAGGGGIDSYYGFFSVVQNCTIADNVGDEGGGIHSANLTLSNSNIRNNRSRLGGGVFTNANNSTVILRNNVFEGNHATVFGGAYHGLKTAYSQHDIFQNLFLSNTTGNLGGACYMATVPEVYFVDGYFSLRQNTFFGNAAAGGGGAFTYEAPERVQLFNNVFSQNRFGNAADVPGADVYAITQANQLSAQHAVSNNHFQVLPGTISAAQLYNKGNLLNLNGLFADATQPAGTDGTFGTADDGLRPAANCSPIVNAGMLNTDNTSDLTGAARVQMGFTDMGAYESAADHLPIFKITGPSSGQAVVLTVQPTSGNNASYLWNGGLTPNAVENTFVNAGTYMAKVTATLPNGCSRADSVQISICGRRYVNATAPAGGDGASWATAFNNLDDALAYNASGCGPEIWVAAGTYRPGKDHTGNSNPADPRRKTFLLPAGVKLYGGFTGNETSIEGRDVVAHATVLSGDIGTAGTDSDNCYHVALAIAPNSNSLLDGLRIEGGRANGSGQFSAVSLDVLDSQGAGLYVTNGAHTLRQLTIRDNHSTFGGGGLLSFANSLHVERSSFIANAASSGAGVFASGVHLTLTNSVLLNNTATGSGSGLFLNAGNASVTGNTIVANNSGAAGAVRLESGQTLLANNLFWANAFGGNDQQNGADVSKQHPATATFQHNLLQLPYGNYALSGTELGNIFGVMPQFVDLANPNGPDGYLGSADDGLRLTDCSPAINGGGAAWAGTGKDRAGAARVQGAKVDIGAYEAPESLRSGGGAYLSGATEGNVELTLTVSGGTAYSWSTGANPNAATNVIGQSGLHTVSVALANGCTQVVPFRTLNNRYFVKAGNPAGGDGRSWATAFATLYEALAQPLMPGVEIWMAGGNYPVNAGSHVIVQKNDVNIYGGFAGTEARLSQRQLGLYTTSLIGDNAHYALRVTESNNLRLNGLRFAGGGGAVHVRGAYSEVRVDNPCPQPPCADGYRYFVYNDRLEIRHCTVEGQSAGNALDLAFLSDVTLDSSRLENNRRALNLSNHQKVVIRDNQFLNNTGGAIRLDIWNAQDIISVQRNTFTNNESDFGGAFRLHGENSRPDLEANANADLAFNTFENNRATSSGGAINCSGRGTRSIQRNVFRGNTAQDYGGAVAVLNNGTTERNFFLNNTARIGAALYGGGSVEVNVFSGNHATERGGAFYGTQQYWAIANTFFDNRADEFGGAIFSDYGNLFTTNYALLLENIFWENKRKVGGNYVANVAEADVAKRTVSAAPNVFYNLFQIAESNYDSYIRNESSIEDALFYTNGFGNIFGFDPLFTNPQVPAGQDGQLGTSDDGLRLQPGSAAIDGSEVITAGSIRSSPSSDITGAPRPQGAKKDMGAYEGSCGTLAFVSLYNSRSASNIVNICAGDNLVFNVTANFAVSYQWKRNGVPVGTNSPTLFLNPVTAADAGTYTVTILGCNGGPITPDGIVVSVVPSQPILYVNHQAAPGGNGSSWATAFQHLQNALDVANICTNVQEIWVASGTYKPNKFFEATESGFGVLAHFYVRDGLKLYGGFAGTENTLSERNIGVNTTTLSGDFNGDDNITGFGQTLAIANNLENAFNVLVASAPTNGGVGITLDGFTIRGGNARCTGCSPLTINGNTLSYTNGAGLQIIGGQNTLRNLTLVGNSSYSGGAAMYLHAGSGSLRHSTLTLNRSEFGGGAGAFIDNASYTIEQNTVTDNRTDNNGGGGALRISNASTNLMGNTFAGNVAGTGGGGGIEILGGTVSMQNNTFSGNFANGDGGGLKMSNAQNAVLNNNTFLDNSADAGGGLYLSGTVALSNNTIRNNTIRSGVGGGLAFLGGGPLTLTRNIIQANRTGGFGRGGGIYLSGGSIMAERNFVIGNTAGGGGGFFMESLPSSRLRNNVIAGNSTLNSAWGGGLYIDRNAPDNEVVNTTFYNNTGFYGGGLSTGGSNITIRLINTVFFGNVATGGAPDIHNSNNLATVQVQFSLLQLANAAAYNAGAFNSIAPGFGMKYGQNPLFTAPNDLDGPDNIFGNTDDGLALQNGSPAINAGTTPAPPILTDIANNTRQGAYDLGAYEVTCAPAVFTVGGGGPLCAGQSTTITLSGSQMGATYQLKQNGANTGSPVAGTGNPLAFMVSQPGVYAIVATNTSNSCTSDMTGSATAGVAAATGSIAVTENSGQTPNDGIVCPGETATLTASGGISYKWSTGATMAAITAPVGTYTVFTTDANGCVNIASASISETPIATFSVSGTGNTSIALSGSETGVQYQLLYFGADIFQIGTPTLVGTVLNGTGAGLSFTAPNDGIYGVRAMQVASGCLRDMAGQITVNSLLSSGGCSGGTISVLENSGTAPNDGSICSGPVTLTAPECSLYEWSNGAMTRQITVSPATTTTYSVTVTNDNNSTAYSTTIVVGDNSIAFNTCPGLSMPVEINASNGQVAATAEYIVSADNATHYTYQLSGAMSGSGNGTGSGLLFNPGITGVTISATNGCAATITPCLVEVRVTGSLPNCPVLPTPGEVQIINATCNAQCVATGGSIAAPSTGCPSNSSLQYSVNGSAWSSMLPEYDQDGPAQTIKTRCTCNADNAITSTESAGVTTVPAECTDTNAPNITCPANATVAAGANCTASLASYTAAATANDNCTANPAKTQSPVSGTTIAGSQVVTLTATDAASNSAACTFTVTVVDQTAPNITCPANTTVAAGVNCTASLASYTTAATANDNCTANPAKTQSPVSGTTIAGSQVVTLTATDAASNSAACTFTVTVVDQTAPNITCPANTTVAAGANCTASLASYTAEATANDNCTANPAKIQSPVSGTTIAGSQVVTLTATDAASNSAACTFTVTVVDQTAPNITCPANATVAAGANCTASLASYTTAATVNDNCTANPAKTQSPVSGTTIAGSQVVTMTATDAASNSAACTFTVTVVDQTAPNITCPANATVAAGANCTASLASYTAEATANDNCTANPAKTQSPVSGTTIAGSQVVTLTATDAASNSAACTFTVTVVDQTAPNITCPANTTVAAGANCTASLTSYTAEATANDNCTANPAKTQSPVSGTTIAGSQVVTLTATDAASNSAACTFTVTVVDQTAPNITCPANTTVAAGANCTASLTSYTAEATANDNCTANPAKTQSPVSGTTIAGSQVVTLTATDAASNSSACTFTVTVVDQTAPNITCPANATVAAGANCTASLASYTAEATANDNCTANPAKTQSPVSGTTIAGSQVVTLTATDAASNSSACTFTVTVVDQTAPSITCPSSSTVAATTGLCAAVVNYSVSGSDNCSGWSLLRTSGLQSGAQFPVGTSTVTWRNTDTGGNSSTCSFTVTVTDGQLPGITCPANITANAAGGSCAATVNYTIPTVSDNCSGASAMHVSGGTSGSSFNKGVNTIEWKATDAANNTRTCSFTITVNDNQAPTITCPANLTANTAAGTCAATATFNNATATDNCTPPPTVNQTSGQVSGSSFPKGLHNITFRATDGVGLTKTCSFRITVVDNVLPTITCPSNIVKNTDNNMCTAVATYAVTGADNCTSVSVSRVSGLASGSAFPRGSSTVIWRATDLAGNSTLCSFTITVNDAQLPGISCPASISTNTTTGQCSKVVNYTTPTYSDNCAGGSISLFSGLASGSVFPTGTTTITWRAFDNSANSNICAFTVTVTDNELPVITCPPAASVSGSGSPCGYPSAQLSTPSATDNCAVTSLASNAPTTLPAGATTITWTAGDAAGNQKTCAYVVTVNCGSAARDEVGRMKDEAERESAHHSSLIIHHSSLIPHPSSFITHHLSLSPNPASDIVVITLSNQQINNKSNQQSSLPNQQINNKSNQHLSNQQLSIHDALGRQVWSKKLDAGVEQLSIDMTSGLFENGVYQVVWIMDNTLITKSLVVTKR